MRLLVSGTFIDVNSTIAQTFSVNEIGDLKTRNGGFSNNFTIQLTSAVNDALGFPSEINSGSRNPYLKVEADLYEGNTFLVSGYLRFQVATRDTLECSFFSDNSLWFNLIKDLKLNDLDLSALDHDYTRANIAASFTNTSGYIYPLIEYGEFETAAYTTNVTQWFPAVYVKTIIAAIESAINWRFEGEFFSLPIYDKMIIPFSGKKFVHSQTYLDSFGYGTLKTLKTVAQAIPATNNPIEWTFGGDDEITLPTAGQYTFSGVVTISGAGSIFTDTLKFEILDSGLALVEDITAKIEPNYTSSPLTTYASYPWQTTEDITVPSGGSIRITYTNGGGSSGAIDITTTFLTYQLLPEIAEGSEIQVAAILPDMTVEDFLKYLIYSFGVVPVTEKLTTVVNWYLHKNIKNRISSAKDWTSKLDYGNLQSINFTQFLEKYASTSVIAYTEDSDDSVLSAYRQSSGEFFGQGVISISNEHINRLETIYEAPFSPASQGLVLEGVLYVPKISWKNADGTIAQEPKPHIMLIDGTYLVSDLTGSVANNLPIVDADAGQTLATALPFAWFIKQSYITAIDAIDMGLNYGELTFTTIGEPLKDTYLEDYQDMLNSMKYFLGSFNLDQVDISELDFSVPIYLGGEIKAYFYLNKVENYDGRGLTKVELIKIA